MSHHMSKPRILFFASNPVDTERFRYGQELKILQRHFPEADFRVCLEANRRDVNLLLYKPWDLIHISGAVQENDGGFYLTNENDGMSDLMALKEMVPQTGKVVLTWSYPLTRDAPTLVCQERQSEEDILAALDSFYDLLTLPCSDDEFANLTLPPTIFNVMEMCRI
jgi:hypothetical protein